VSVGDTVPSVDLGVWRTPVERAPRLAARIGLRPDDLWIKRDDWLGLGGGGNKLRKLEFLCAHALEKLDATVLVTGGATQSNYCRLTAASARRLGLGVVLVLAGDGSAGAAGNLTLDGLFRADVHWAGEVAGDALDDIVATVADELRSRGERPAVLPFGGSNALAARGYLACAAELEEQAPGAEHVVVAVGSGADDGRARRGPGARTRTGS
jgi:L-cysteate sulfo-lyase